MQQFTMDFCIAIALFFSPIRLACREAVDAPRRCPDPNCFSSSVRQPPFESIPNRDASHIVFVRCTDLIDEVGDLDRFEPFQTGALSHRHLIFAVDWLPSRIRAVTASFLGLEETGLVQPVGFDRQHTSLAIPPEYWHQFELALHGASGEMSAFADGSHGVLSEEMLNIQAQAPVSDSLVQHERAWPGWALYW